MTRDSSCVLQEDVFFGELLQDQERFEGLKHNKQLTDMGVFRPRMYELDWTPGGAVGRKAWDIYFEPDGFEMIFTKASAKQVSQALCEVEPQYQCVSAAENKALWLTKEKADVIVVLELRDWAWNLVFELGHPDPYPGEGLDERIERRALSIHSITKADVIAISNVGTVFLADQKEPEVIVDSEWYDSQLDKWLEQKNVFLPPYTWTFGKTKTSNQGFFHIWLAGVSLGQVARLDILLAEER